jgi:hypothetical protein
MRNLLPLASGSTLLLLAACHTMRPVPPAALGAVPGLERVWVTRADHSRVIVLSPQVQGDTLKGYIFGEFQKMPVSETLAIQERRSAPARTVALVLTAGAVVLAGVIYQGNRSYVGNAQTCTTGLPDDNPIACPHTLFTR